MFGQVKNWRFFMWLDRYLDTLVTLSEIWMINAIARSELREVEQRTDAMRAQADAMRAQTDALRAEIDAARSKFESLKAQNAKLQVIVYLYAFVSIVLLLVLLMKLVKENSCVMNRDSLPVLGGAPAPPLAPAVERDEQFRLVDSVQLC